MAWQRIKRTDSATVIFQSQSTSCQEQPRERGGNPPLEAREAELQGRRHRSSSQRASELNRGLGAARMRWFRLMAILEAFEKVTGNETTTVTATAASVDTTTEGTKGAEESDEVKGGNNDEDAK
ncbi:hypothetical protein N7527_006963 [Penicillium freii]|nr:hypothetical protein N7527_006963 [Penicillium freii]